jgi:hypothetical protein
VIDNDHQYHQHQFQSILGIGFVTHLRVLSKFYLDLMFIFSTIEEHNLPPKSLQIWEGDNAQNSTLGAFFT